MIDLDLSDLTQFTTANVRAISGFARRAKQRIEAAVERDRTKHKYVSRTHRLERSTVCKSTESGADVDVTAEQGMHYASYVNNREFSRFERDLNNVMLAIDADARRLAALAGS